MFPRNKARFDDTSKTAVLKTNLAQPTEMLAIREFLQARTWLWAPAPGTLASLNTSSRQQVAEAIQAHLETPR
jgi:hypothetical protein